MVHRPTRGEAPVRLRVGESVRPDVGPSTLDADTYRDPEQYEAERRMILQRSWLIAGRSSEIANPNDWMLYEGHGETVVVSRQADGGVAAFHNVCQHRGARLTRGESAGCDRRFVCPWHGWVYDTTGDLVGVPEREDFDRTQLDGLRARVVAADEWGGWVWINMEGAAAPRLLDWIGPEIDTDFAPFHMEDMVVLEKAVYDIPVNYKAVVDGFNEVYHVTELHHVDAEFTKSARNTAFYVTGPNSMMFVPRHNRIDELAETGDHHQHSICHYVIFPNSVFNNNPDNLQLFQPIPLAADRTRFICWELIYGPDGSDDADYAQYYASVVERWAELKRIVEEDVFVFNEVGATKHSMGYTQNIFSERECKPTKYHETVRHCLSGGHAMDRWEQSE